MMRHSSGFLGRLGRDLVSSSRIPDTTSRSADVSLGGAQMILAPHPGRSAVDREAGTEEWAAKLKQRGAAGVVFADWKGTTELALPSPSQGGLNHARV